MHKSIKRLSIFITSTLNNQSCFFLYQFKKTLCLCVLFSHGWKEILTLEKNFYFSQHEF